MTTTNKKTNRGGRPSKADRASLIVSKPVGLEARQWFLLEVWTNARNNERIDAGLDGGTNRSSILRELVERELQRIKTKEAREQRARTAAVRARISSIWRLDHGELPRMGGAE